MTFRVGQKVVYFRELPFSWGGWWTKVWHPMPGDDLTIGEVYTISKITWEDQLELVGINSSGDKWWCDGFAPECFRPVIERKTDISVFTAMLTPKKTTVRA